MNLHTFSIKNNEVSFFFTLLFTGKHSHNLAQVPIYLQFIPSKINTVGHLIS